MTGEPEDLFVKLAQSLAASSDIQRQDFAWLAVSEMAKAYEGVLEDSGSVTPKTPEAWTKLLRWRHATRDYTYRLHRSLDLIDASADIRVHTQATGSVVVLVNSDPIVISGPDLTASRMMSRRIVDAYCELHACTQLAAAPPELRAETKPIGRGLWVINRPGGIRYETPDGLVFLLASLSGREEKQAFCENFAEELRRLAEGLRNAKRAGFSLDWDFLQVRPLEDTDASHVLLNERGDYLRLKLSYLEKNNPLRKDLLAWVRAVVNGTKPDTVLVRVNHLTFGGILSRR